MQEPIQLVVLEVVELMVGVMRVDAMVEEVSSAEQTVDRVSMERLVDAIVAEVQRVLLMVTVTEIRLRLDQ